MKAVNLIPADARGRSRNRGPATGMQIPVYVLLGVLTAAVALVTVYVLANNSITSRTATLNNLKAQVAQEQAAVARLGEFTKFSQLAQTRISTVKAIAAARFDWHAALGDLSKVVPANTSLSQLVGTVVPGANGGGAAGTGGLRSNIAAPAFELTGCTRSQDDVARLMSQLRLINGVTRVTLSNSQEAGGAVSGGGSGGSAQGCGANAPSFALVVFFQPVANAGASGVTSLAGAASSGSGTTTTSGATTTTSGATTPTSGATTPTSGATTTSGGSK